MALNTKRIIPILTFIFGAVWIFVGLTEYNWMIEGTPGKGFFPSIIGGLMMLVSVILFFQDYHKKKIDYQFKHLFPIIAVLIIVGSSYIIGMILAIALYMLIWLFAYEKYSLKFSIIFTVCGTLFIYGVFAVWLNIPFPTGLLPV
jgi:hypothetical protein